MKLQQIINEIQYKTPSTYLDRENVSGVYGVASLNDLFPWHHNKITSHNRKKKDKNTSKNKK